MTKTVISNARGARWILRALLVWLMISSLYYIDTLFTASFIFNYEENLHHKIVKYGVCLAFSSYLLFRTGKYALLWASYGMLAIAAVTTIFLGEIALSVLVIMTIATMGGFVVLLQRWPEASASICKVLIYSGVIVGCFSVVELTVLSALFQTYWAATDGIRSISTMFNPNNLGLYVGAVLIVLPFASIGRIKKIFFAIPILFALIASGSRTAWVSLIVVCVMMVVLDREITVKLLEQLKRHVGVILVVSLISFIGIMFVGAQMEMEPIESSYRGANLYTASIRVENFFAYFQSLNWDVLLLPDLYGKRTHYIQDNFYLVALNSFGLLPLVVLLIFFLSQMRIVSVAPLENRIWRWMFVYYTISGFSGSFINSFPNNQLFFVALGSFFVREVLDGTRVSP